MLLKVILINTLLVCNFLKSSKTENRTNDNASYNVVKMQTFKGHGLEAVYKIYYYNKSTNTARFFEVIKTSSEIKSYFLADYLLVEKVKSGSKFIYYPTGWESIKYINVSELKQTCQSVVKGEIHSELME